MICAGSCLLAAAPFDDPSLVTLRIELGVGDEAPATVSQPPGARWFPPVETSAAGLWHGRVAAVGGTVESLTSLRPRPSDAIRPDSWELESWQGPSFGHPPEKPQPVTGTRVNVFNPGLLLRVRTSGGTRLDFDTDQGDFSLSVARLGPGGAQRFLDGRVVVATAVTTERITDERYEDDFAAVATGPDGRVWICWVGYRDSANEVFLRHYDGDRWEAPHVVTESQMLALGFLSIGDGAL